MSSNIYSLLLLANNKGDNSALKNFITANSYGSMFVFGGIGVISDSVMNDISKSLCTDIYNTPAKPQNLAVQLVNPTEIKLTWDELNDAEYYRIYRNGQYIDTSYVNYYSQINLPLDTTYTYKVTGVNSNGEGEYSESVTVSTPKIMPQAPASINVSLTIDNSVTISWLYSDYAKYYKIYRNGEYLATTTTSNWYDDKSVQPNVTYTYKVLAGNSLGESGFTAEKAITTYQYPSVPPTNLVTKRITSTEADLAWDMVPGAIKYIVTYPGGPILETITNSITLTGLTPGSQYGVAVKTVTDAGESSNSSYIFIYTYLTVNPLS